MCGNNTIPKNQRLPQKPANGQIPKWSSAVKAWIAADESGSGVNAYLNIAYADDANGNGFTTVFSPAKNYIAIKHTSNPITPVQADFAGLWFNYKGQKGDPGNNGNNGADGADGADGKDGQSAFVYIGYADDENGDGFSEVFDPDKGYIAIRNTTWEMDGQDPGTFAGYWTKYKGDDGVAGQNGQSAYLYIAYADDSNGAGFTTVFNAAKNFIAIRSSTAPLTPVQADFAGRWFNYKGQQGNPGANGTNGSNGLNGQSAYVYIAYANDAAGSGFTTVFTGAQNYIAIKSSIVPLTPVQGDFAGLWFKYKGEPGINGTNGTNGLNGQSAYVYIAYADSNTGTGFTTAFNAGKNYIAIKTSTVPLTPVQSDFNGLWFNYKGQAGVNGTNGSDGSNGLNGQNAFLYIAYADDVDGNGYSSTFDPNKNFIALFQATEPTDISQSTFDGLWVQYKGSSGGGDTGSISIQRQDLSEDYTFTPVHDKFYLFNPGGSERKVYLDVPTTSIRFTIKNIDAEGGGGVLSVRDLDEAVIKSITLGKSAQILFDNSTNTWEVIEC